ncbi:hypothetical protein V2J09_016231 [Rumex salicifolius]
MDGLQDYEQIQNNSTTPRNGGTGPGRQICFEDTTSSLSTNMRPPETIMSGGMKPVLNYSIQTGEEFALEFMRERVNTWQQFIPNSSGNTGAATGNTGIKTIIGSSRTRSEGDTDISVAPSIEKCHANKGRGVRASTQSLPMTSAKSDINLRVRAYASSGTSNAPPKVKFLCSFGGKIIPRPSDKKLRYVGGETHIIHISKYISWSELMQKACLMYKETYAIKYQLPGEDLDALVSVSSDEDLQNMMEECCSPEVSGSNKARMFLFSVSDLKFGQFGLVNMEANSEVHFLIAVNDMDFAPSKDLTELKSTSVNALDELFSLKVDRLVYSSDTVDVGKVNALQPTVPSASCSNESTSLNCQPGLSHDELNALNSKDIRAHLDKEDTYYSSAPLQGCNIYPPSYAVVHGNKDSEDCLKVAQLKRDFSLESINGVEQAQNIEKETSGVEGKLTRENSSPKINETESYHGASNSCSDSIPQHNHVQDSSGATSAVGSGSPSAHTRTNRIFHESIKVSASSKTVVKDTSHEQNESHTSAGVINHQLVDDHANGGLLEQSVLSQRFHSEWIPRETAGQSRLSKSDDSFGTQVLMAHLQLNPTYPFAEANDPRNGNSKTEYPMLSAEFSSMKPEIIGDTRQDASKEQLQNITDVNDHNFSYQLSGSNGMMPAVGYSAVRNITSKQNLDDLAASGSDCSQDKTTAISHGNQVTSQEQFHSSISNSSLDATQEKTSAETEASGQGDILIDINDRFPRDFLADVFSMARISQGLPGFCPLGGDGTNLSIDMENPEPGHWSFFRNLAKDDFVRKDESYIDDSHHIFSSPEDAKYSLAESDSLPLNDSRLMFDVVNQDHTSGTDGSNNLNSHSNNHTSHTESNDFERFNAIEHEHMENSEYEDGTGIGVQNSGSLFDPSLRNFDPFLQIIKNKDLEELKELGSGTFGTVYHGKWRGTDVAIKRIKKSCFTGRSSEQERLTVEFWSEAKILSKLHHPNVVAFYGVVQDGPGCTLATVTEYMVNGSLRHVLVSKDRFLDRRKRLIIAMDAAFGMEYLHSKNIVHFDLKCDNLLVNLRDPVRPICKVGDFGLSKIKRNTLVTGGVRGTLPWMAPELLNGSSTKVSEKVDVFSFGVVLWEILTGEEPYANMHYGAIIGGIVNNTLRPPIPSSCDPDWSMLMEECWAPDPIARPCFTEIAARLRIMTASVQSKHK